MDGPGLLDCGAPTFRVRELTRVYTYNDTCRYIDIGIGIDIDIDIDIDVDIDIDTE